MYENCVSGQNQQIKATHAFSAGSLIIFDEVFFFLLFSIGLGLKGSDNEGTGC